jgi:TatD DNase family protein
MYITDTHTHLHFDQYATDLKEVIHRAREGGVKRILTLGTDYHSSLQSQRISQKYNLVYSAVGIHPTDILKHDSKDILRVKKLADAEPKIVAIGEIGFDLYWKEVPLEKQIPVFAQMLEIAVELNLPVVIHNRDAHREMRDFFEKRQIKKISGVMHSFSGSLEDARFYLDLGLHISFTGVITFKNFKGIEVVKSVPLDRILLETDSPFLTPVPNRGKRNEPAFVEFIARRLAEIYELPLQEVTHNTFQNANQLFRWNR